MPSHDSQKTDMLMPWLDPSWVLSMDDVLTMSELCNCVGRPKMTTFLDRWSEFTKINYKAVSSERMAIEVLRVQRRWTERFGTETELFDMVDDAQSETSDEVEKDNSNHDIESGDVEFNQGSVNSQYTGMSDEQPYSQPCLHDQSLPYTPGMLHPQYQDGQVQLAVSSQPVWAINCNTLPIQTSALHSTAAVFDPPANAIDSYLTRTLRHYMLAYRAHFEGLWAANLDIFDEYHPNNFHATIIGNSPHQQLQFSQVPALIRTLVWCNLNAVSGIVDVPTITMLYLTTRTDLAMELFRYAQWDAGVDALAQATLIASDAFPALAIVHL